MVALFQASVRLFADTASLFARLQVPPYALIPCVCRYVAKADALIKTAIAACDNGPAVPPQELEADMEHEIQVSQACAAWASIAHVEHLLLLLLLLLPWLSCAACHVEPSHARQLDTAGTHGFGVPSVPPR